MCVVTYACNVSINFVNHIRSCVFGLVGFPNGLSTVLMGVNEHTLIHPKVPYLYGS